VSEIHPEESANTHQSSTPPSSGAGQGLQLLREVFETLLLALVAFALIRLVVQNYRIEGPSMEPNLLEGQFLAVNKLAYRLGRTQRGDVVVFHYSNASPRDLIKRVIGLPGDRLEIVRGQVWINGQPVVEPYVREPGTYSQALTVIEPGFVFVMGDNRNNSNDSRRWGSLPMDHVIGKAIFCYWPPRAWGLVPHQQPIEP
jgi:signal peptidase I